ncbi:MULTISPECIES: hypothetical protein [unclassified Romboutsia]|uniref:hypothetical protein n=1 Tax=unclassified Romboutsia TaxID=2626894 RepID=UPI0008204688|nr:MULTISPECIES: hypothetical protein [unclassified Romboutsia]SCH36623.1 Uncharacterised protein [uncultured Clostridium sp.]
MKNFIIVLLLSLFIALSVKIPTIYAFNNISTLNSNNIFKYNNDNYTLIVKILKDTNKDNLIPYADLINIEVIDNIPNSTTNNMAYILSLPQQSSFIVLYTPTSNNNYVIDGIIDNVSTVINLYYYKDFIAVEQTDSSSSTNFTKREFLEIFFKKNKSYISVFKKNIYMEKIIKNSNCDNNDILKEVETSSIDYLEGDFPRILCVNTLTLYNGIFLNLTNSYEFIENKKDTKKEIFEWCPEIECFSIKKEL